MAQASYVGSSQLYLYDTGTGQYTEYGSHGIAIMGTADGVFKLGCYNDKSEYVCTAPITANNEASAKVALQGSGYVSFRDDQGRNWSLMFPSEDDAIEFGAHVAVAMYGAAYQPEAHIIACDVAQGKKERILFTNDKVKVRYTSWVVQRGTAGKDICKLGSKLESNENEEKPYAFTVPANHLSVQPDMKGFEGMVIGVGEEGKRFIVIPQAARKGSGPNTHMCFYVSVLRKKDNDGTGSQGGNPNMGGYNNNNGGNNMNNMGGYNNNFGGNNMNNGAMQIGYHGGYDGGYQQQGRGPMPVALVEPEPVPVAAVAPTPVAAPPVVMEAPPPPPPGFSAEQLQIVDRMRDQIQALTIQLKEATGKLDMFRHDYNQHQAKVKPQSLGSAQLEHSLQRMIQETDDMKEELSERDTMLRRVEEKNKELQKKVDRFTSTANQLADEKKAALNQGSEEKVDLDRRIAQLQGQVTRIQGEREDVARHMSTVKRLLEVSDQDMKTEKNKLQIAIVQFQTNESKLVTLEEALSEERARKKVLESKVITLGEELRSVTEELRIKEGQIEERKRKIEADKLHYTQVMEEERSSAAAELRELRQELIDEIAIRDRRYHEEKQRVAQESVERGRTQGVEDGHNEALLEADAKIQEYVLSVQRCRSEVESMKIRLRQVKEQADTDQRRIQAQAETLTRVIDDLDQQNSTADLEIDALNTKKITVEESTFDRLCHALRGLSRPINKKDLLTLIHNLRVEKPIDYSFETDREEEEVRRLVEERREVEHWAEMSLSPESAKFGLKMPPFRTKHAEEKPIPSTFAAEETLSRQPQQQTQEVVYTATPVSAAYEPEPEPEVVDANPYTPPQSFETQQQAYHVDPVYEAAVVSERSNSPSEDFPVEADFPVETPTPAATHHEAPLSDSENAYPTPPPQPVEEGDSPAEGPIIPPQRAPVVYSDTDEDVPPPPPPMADQPPISDEEEDNSFAPPVVAAPPATLPDFSDEDDNKPAPPRALPPKKMPSLADSDDEAPPIAAAPPKKFPGKKATNSLFDGDTDSDDGSMPPPPAPKKAAPKKSVMKKAPAKSLFDDSDED